MKISENVHPLLNLSRRMFWVAADLNTPIATDVPGCGGLDIRHKIPVAADEPGCGGFAIRHKII